MTILYLQTNVFEEALNRIRFLYDNHDDVIVSMSGGKDSTVLFHLALMVAQERGRLPQPQEERKDRGGPRRSDPQGRF